MSKAAAKHVVRSNAQRANEPVAAPSPIATVSDREAVPVGKREGISGARPQTHCSAALPEDHGELFSCAISKNRDRHCIAGAMRVQRIAELVEILHRPTTEFHDDVARDETSDIGRAASAYTR